MELAAPVIRLTKTVLILQDLWLVPAVSAAWPWAMREEVMDLATDSVGYGLYLYDAWLNE